MIHIHRFTFLLLFLFTWINVAKSQQLELNDLEYFEANGINVLVYSNRYNPVFFDEKTAGLELIHHGVRTATGGAIRLHHTPEQWDLVPEIVSRDVDKNTNTISTVLRYADFNFDSEIKVTPHNDGFKIQVFLDKPVPAELVGRAGFNLEFLPPDYWESIYLADGSPKLFPRYPASDTRVKPKRDKIQQIYDHSTFDDRGRAEYLEPLPISTANAYVLAPDNPERKVTIQSDAEIMFFDGRILAQNGWYVFRSLLPSGKTGKVMEWYVEAHTIPDWIREPNIGFSQVGYTPAQQKKAVIELDKNDQVQSSATIYSINPNGSIEPIFTGKTEEWGRYLRYNYLVFDFTEIKEKGVYFIEYNGHRTNAFPIADDVYNGIWHATMDVWLPIQMDHMTVNEGYRIWHGNAHQDDALQAPTNHSHFDGYRMGDTTDTRFKPFERITGLDVGGWYDAGDFDIQTGSHNSVVMDLVEIYETFAPDRDMTYVDQASKYTDLHRPDGKNDLLQQLEHGVLALVAQIEHIGHPIRGIVVGNLHQYHHLGDAATITDNLPYNPDLAPYETDGKSSGTLDDRWVFTNRSPYMDYATAASLAASSRVLKDFNPKLSEKALRFALKMWDDNIDNEQDNSRQSFFWGSGNLNAALQLFITTKENRFKKAFEKTLWDQLKSISPMFDTNRPGNFPVENAFSYAIMAYPHMDAKFHKKLQPYVVKYKEQSDKIVAESPYEVPMGGRGWAGNTPIMKWAINNYFISQYYPDLMGTDDVFKAMNYILGCHPYSNLSFVTTIGARSKKVTYGSNRADFTFIAGGVVPGLVLLQPDFYENKDDWPFLWAQNEAIITTATPYVFLAHAVEKLAKELNKDK